MSAKDDFIDQLERNRAWLTKRSTNISHTLSNGVVFLWLPALSMWGCLSSFTEKCPTELLFSEAEIIERVLSLPESCDPDSD